jgi:hypothetical protein
VADPDVMAEVLLKRIYADTSAIGDMELIDEDDR